MFGLIENTELIVAAIPESAGLLAAGVGLVLAVILIRKRISTDEKISR